MNKEEYKEYMHLQRQKVYDAKTAYEQSNARGDKAAYTRAENKLNNIRENIANGFKIDTRSAGDPKR